MPKGTPVVDRIYRTRQHFSGNTVEGLQRVSKVEEGMVHVTRIAWDTGDDPCQGAVRHVSIPRSQWDDFCERGIIFTSSAADKKFWKRNCQ